MSVLLPFFYSLTIFASGALLFLLPPVLGKMLLPYLGGTTAAWSTCIVFFQAMVLFGYLYVYLLQNIKCIRRQTAVQAILLLVGLAPLFLLKLDPTTLSGYWAAPLDDGSSYKLVGWLFVALFATAGLPLLALAANLPLLVKWFAGTSHSSARDPYYLFAIGSFGGLLAVVGYPFFLEEWVVDASLDRTIQIQDWAIGYGVVVLLVIVCGVIGYFGQAPAKPGTDLIDPARVPVWYGRLRWILLAFIPSSQLVSLTARITTETAAGPLPWALPLAVYLFSFVLVFTWLRRVLHPVMLLALPVAIAAGAFASKVPVLSERWIPYTMNPADTLHLHLAALFVTSMVCHGEIARTRPHPRYSPTLFMEMALGAFLGGAFTFLICPLIFNRCVEYPLIMVVPCLVFPRVTLERHTGWRIFELSYGVLLFLLGLVAGSFLLAKSYVPQEQFQAWVNDKFPDRGATPNKVGSWLARQLPWVETAYVVDGKTVRAQSVIRRERTLLGGITVLSRTRDGAVFDILTHGASKQDLQGMEDSKRKMPLGHFHRLGPVGQLFEAVKSRSPGEPLTIGVVGIGTGSIAAYVEPKWKLTAYEVEPAIARLAEGGGTDLFTFLADARKKEGAVIEVKIGNARLLLEKEPEQTFDLLFIDVANADTLPTQLLTKEALETYKKVLKPNGIVAFDITNPRFDLESMMGQLAREASLRALVEHSEEDRKVEKSASVWVVMARDDAAFGKLRQLRDGKNRWERPLVGNGRAPSDEYFNLHNLLHDLHRPPK